MSSAEKTCAAAQENSLNPKLTSPQTSGNLVVGLGLPKKRSQPHYLRSRKRVRVSRPGTIQLRANVRGTAFACAGAGRETSLPTLRPRACWKRPSSCRIQGGFRPWRRRSRWGYWSRHRTCCRHCRFHSRFSLFFCRFLFGGWLFGLLSWLFFSRFFFRRFFLGGLFLGRFLFCRLLSYCPLLLGFFSWFFRCFLCFFLRCHGKAPSSKLKKNNYCKPGYGSPDYPAGRGEPQSAEFLACTCARPHAAVRSSRSRYKTAGSSSIPPSQTWVIAAGSIATRRN